MSETALRLDIAVAPDARRPLPFWMRLAAVMLIGAGTGLGATALAVSTGVGFGTIEAGPWRASPRTGSVDADPYTKARLARSGEIPLGLGEGVVFRARTDSAGALLTGTCRYQLVGRAPQARYWTLTAQAPDGKLLQPILDRHGFTSTEVLRDPTGRFAIALSPDVSPGNWLPVTPGPFTLVLRLYDTPISGTSGVLDPALMPRITKVDCA